MEFADAGVSLNSLERFEQLYREGYFDRDDVKKFHEDEGYDNPIQTYNEFWMTKVPPEFIMSYEIWKRVRTKEDSFELLEGEHMVKN